MVFNLSDQDSIANEFLAQLRDKRLHHDRLRFRQNMEKLGQILAFEISKVLNYKEVSVETPLAEIRVRRITSQPVLITILRAGIPFLQGFLNCFVDAETGFIGAYRRENEADLKINMEYAATPVIENREIIIIDPMLATGSSLAITMRHLFSRFKPSRVHIAAAIAAPEGIGAVQNFFRHEFHIPFSIWVGCIDKELNSQFYIVPGLGDAGDLSFGSKI